MARNKQKKEENSSSEIFENPDAIVDRVNKAEEFVKQNKQVVTLVAAAIAIAVFGYFGYRYYLTSQNQEAQQQIFQAVYYFEADSLDRALHGDEQHPGFLSINDDYGMTKAGNLSNFYIGAIYLKKGRYDDAIKYLKDFNGGDLLLKARAYALIGDAYMQKGNTEQAIDYYEDAADYKPNKETTPGYLLKLGIACEEAGKYDKAVKAYEKIINNYPDYRGLSRIKKFKAYAEAKAKG